MTESAKILSDNINELNKYCKDYLESIGLNRAGRFMKKHDTVHGNHIVLSVTIDHHSKSESYIWTRINLIKEKFETDICHNEITRGIALYEFVITEDTFFNYNFVKSMLTSNKYNL